MGATWVISLEHMLDENGEINGPKGLNWKLAEHIYAIVAMASRPKHIPQPRFQVRCRRWPGRKQCPGRIKTIVEPFDRRIVWWCPVCQENGYIRNWQGSIWDLRNSEEIH